MTGTNLPNRFLLGRAALAVLLIAGTSDLTGVRSPSSVCGLCRLATLSLLLEVTLIRGRVVACTAG